MQVRLRTDAGGVSKINAPGVLELGKWIHVAMTWDADDPNTRLYENGAEIHMAPQGGTAVGTNPDVKIGVGNQSVSAGADSMDRPFNGVLDDVAIWNRGLTPAEIVEMMTVGIPLAVESDGKLTTTWAALKQ